MAVLFIRTLKIEAIGFVDELRSQAPVKGQTVVEIEEMGRIYNQTHRLILSIHVFKKPMKAYGINKYVV